MNNQLEYCPNCSQMTNHKDGTCLKCKEMNFLDISCPTCHSTSRAVPHLCGEELAPVQQPMMTEPLLDQLEKEQGIIYTNTSGEWHFLKTHRGLMGMDDYVEQMVAVALMDLRGEIENKKGVYSAHDMKTYILALIDSKLK